MFRSGNDFLRPQNPLTSEPWGWPPTRTTILFVFKLEAAWVTTASETVFLRVAVATMEPADLGLGLRIILVRLYYVYKRT